MILADTNIVVDAHDRRSPFRSKASELLAHAVATEGAGINAVVLAELWAGARHEKASIEDEIRAEGLSIFDLPAEAAVICGQAYRQYRVARRRSAGSDAPRVPLPDFFIGAHAQLMGWKLATRDTERFRLYFPKVELVIP